MILSHSKNKGQDNIDFSKPFIHREYDAQAVQLWAELTGKENEISGKILSTGRIFGRGVIYIWLQNRTGEPIGAKVYSLYQLTEVWTTNSNGISCCRFEPLRWNGKEYILLTKSGETIIDDFEPPNINRNYTFEQMERELDYTIAHHGRTRKQVEAQKAKIQALLDKNNPVRPRYSKEIK